MACRKIMLGVYFGSAASFGLNVAFLWKSRPHCMENWGLVRSSLSGLFELVCLTYTSSSPAKHLVQ